MRPRLRNPTPFSSSARRLRPLLGAALLVPVVALTVLPGASASTPAGTAAAPQTASTNVVWQYQVRAVGVDPSVVAGDLLADGYDVATRSGADLFVIAGAARRSDLAARTDLTLVAATPVAPADDLAGVAADQDAILPRRLDGNTYPTFYDSYRTHQAFWQFEDDLAAAYPELVKVVEYGRSQNDFDPLRAVCVTSDADEGCELTPDVDKARFLVLGQIHAREWTTGETAWRLITTLVDGHGRRADITAMLDDTEVWIVPQANPEGTYTSEIGVQSLGFGTTSPVWQRKNDNTDLGVCGSEPQFEQRGVDLNRNFAANWGGPGSSSDPCDLTYRGASAASESETSELQDLFRTLFEDQRGPGGAVAPPTTRGAMVSLHSYGDLVVFPYGSGAAAPNDAGLRSMAFRMSKFNGYETGRPGEILYEVSGSTDDWTYQDLGIASFSYEIGSQDDACGGFFPAYSCQDDLYKTNKDALLYGISAAQQPYTASLGPTVLKAKSSLAGSTVEITAIADDNAYGKSGVGRPASQRVVAARLFVGTPPWDGGTATPMSVVGAGKRVSITGSVPAGRKRVPIYLQAKDATGAWGPTSVVWRTPAV